MDRPADRQLLTDIVRIPVVVLAAVHIDRAAVGRMAGHCHTVAAGKAPNLLRARSTTCPLWKLPVAMHVRSKMLGTV